MDDHLYREGLDGRAGPLDVNLAFDFVHQVLNVGATDRMDRDALAARNITHDGLAADRVTTLGPVDQQVVDAFDFDDQVLIAACRRGSARTRRNGGRGRLRHFEGDLAGRHFLENLTRRELTVPERGVQILNLAVTVFGGDGFDLVLWNPHQLHAETARFALEIFLADLDCLGARRRVDDVPDLVARFGGFDECEPVLARKMARLGENLDDVAITQSVL